MLESYLFITCAFLLFPSSQSKLISYTSDGLWLPAKADECDDRHFLCTPNNLMWAPDNGNFTTYNNESACDALVKRGIRRIMINGDSYMRHLYAALLITLTGNYKDGSINDPLKSPQCTFHAQFADKKCSTAQLKFFGGDLCNGKLTLEPVLKGYVNLKTCSDPGTVVLFSHGNLRTTRYGRMGVNNATCYQNHFEGPICQPLRDMKENSTLSIKAGKEPMYTGDVSKSCSFWWVSTHYRQKPYFWDESVEYVRDFNYGMRKFFDEGKCGLANYIDVYNMTAHLCTKHADQVPHLTYDGMHWGYVVNLIKAQIVINALLARNGDPNQMPV